MVQRVSVPSLLTANSIIQGNLCYTCERRSRSADNMALKFLKSTLIVNARFSFDLPAQNLVVALREFGKQTDLSLAYRVEDIDTIEMWCQPWIGLPG